MGESPSQKGKGPLHPPFGDGMPQGEMGRLSHRSQRSLPPESLPSVLSKIKGEGHEILHPGKPPHPHATQAPGQF